MVTELNEHTLPNGPSPFRPPGQAGREERADANPDGVSLRSGNPSEDAQLTIIGEGPLKEQLEAYIQEHHLEAAVTLLGPCTNRQALAELQQHHVFCQHSVTGMDGDQEGFALSPAEAALFEMPVVATWHNGIPNMCNTVQTGLLVREWDIEAMAQAMSHWLRHQTQRWPVGRRDASE